jgi:hypothetical protein
LARRAQAGRGRRVAARAGRVGEVVELAAAFVAKGDEPVAEGLEMGGGALQAREGREVGGRRRAEGEQVLDQEKGCFRIGLRIAAQPGLGHHETAPGGVAPGGLVGGLDQGQEDAGGVGEGAHLVIVQSFKFLPETLEILGF